VIVVVAVAVARSDVAVVDGRANRCERRTSMHGCRYGARNAVCDVLRGASVGRMVVSRQHGKAVQPEDPEAGGAERRAIQSQSLQLLRYKPGCLRKRCSSRVPELCPLDALGQLASAWERSRRINTAQ